MCKIKRCPARATKQGRNPNISGKSQQRQIWHDELTKTSTPFTPHEHTNDHNSQVHLCTFPHRWEDKDLDLLVTHSHNRNNNKQSTILTCNFQHNEHFPLPSPTGLLQPQEESSTKAKMIPIFELSTSSGVGDEVAADAFTRKLDEQLGIRYGETRHFLDGGYYIYLPVDKVGEERFHYEVPYPTLVSFSAIRRQVEELELAVVLQDGRCFKVAPNGGMTTDELRWRIFQRTGITPGRMTLTVDGIPLAEGPIQCPLGGPIYAMSKLTGGAGGTRTSARKKKAARRATKYRMSLERLSYSETLEIMERRENKFEETTEQEVVELMSDMVCESVRESAEQAELEFRRQIASQSVKLHGNAEPTNKIPEGFRAMSLNINGLQMSKSANHKAERLRYILPKYDIDVLGMQETCVNWRRFKPSHTVASLLRSRTESIRSTHSFNKHETDNIGTVQRGGTATVATDQISSYVKSSGSDHTNLGRWSYYLLEGEPGHKTRVVTAYSPCGSRNSGLSTNWQAQLRYIKQNGIRAKDPKQMFDDDLCAALKAWRAQGDRIILLMDANENVHSGNLTRRLSEEGLEMKEAVHDQTEGQGPNTHNRGSQPIDGVWFTPDLELKGASYLPFDGSLGDHRPVIADFSQRSVLGTNLPKIVPVKARRLNSKVKRIRDSYIQSLEEAFKKGEILSRLRSLEKDATFPASEEVASALERIDNEMENHMLMAERSCRKLYAGHYDFSPTVQFWLKRCHAYRALIKLRDTMDNAGTRDPRHHALRKKNAANTYRSAERAGISRAKELSKTDLLMQYGYCREQTKHLLAEAPWLRKQFLSRKLEDAMLKHNEEEAKRTKEMMRREKQSRTWRSIQKVTKPNNAGAVTFVDEKNADGTTTRHTTKATVERAIAGEILPRFARASSAPICQGALFGLLGYGANTETAIEILERRFVPPEDTDGPTMLLLDEIGRIWSEMEAGNVNIVVTKDDFQHFWKRMNERTSSSYSKLHIGHYKSAAYSEELSTIHSLKLSLISKTGSAPERWAKGLSVMLEKIAGVALVTKLRAILLMEADFNYHNKLIFGKRMMDLARQHDLVPEEIYSEKGKTSEDAILHQVLAYDIARQTRAPFIVASVDAAQCYDRIAHAMAALTLRASKVPDSSVHCMLQPIRDMEFYIRTAFGESESFVGGKDVLKQGGGQGNGAAPPTWQQIATTMIRAQQRAGHGVTVKCPISKKTCRKVGILYVDDTNLWAGLTPDDDLIGTADKAQKGIDCWGELLMATGGSLNPKKCFWTVHDMKPRADGSWAYRQCKPALETIEEGNEMPGTDQNERDDDEDVELDEIVVTIPQSSGEKAAIIQLQSSQATENLGLLAPPDGNPSPQFKVLQKKVDDWTERIKGGYLPARSNWLSYQCQLWPGLKYGLGTSTATIEQLETGLGRRDHKILGHLGICRNIPTELRYIPSCFGGFALRSLTTEATAESLNMFLQHYGTESSLGIFLTATIENLQLELGVTGCPFTYDYSIWKDLATDSWIKSLWERIQHFGIDLQIEYNVLPMPRTNDECIMERCVAAGVRGHELASINRVRKHQEALFLSDIATADGEKLDEAYLQDWHQSEEFQLGRHRSNFGFGRECPTEADWAAWSNYWHGVCKNSIYSRLPCALGGWRAESPRIWRVFYDEKEDRLEVLSDKKGLVYFERERGKFIEQSAVLDVHPSGLPATVRWLPNGTAKLSNVATCRVPNAEENEAAADLREYLKSWGGEWMWRDLRLGDDPSWVADSLDKGTLVCVTDGSYNKNMDPEICSAGWIIQCRETGKRIIGTVTERSASAGSYRGELLGMLAIRLFLLAVEEFYETVASGNQICCDNKGALYTFGKKSKRVPKGRSNSDIHRVIRTINSRMKSKYIQNHVKAHQDDHALLRNLTFEAQLNCICDHLAKHALSSYHNNLADSDTRAPRLPVESRLPLEAARIYVDGEKQTTDVGKGLSYAMGRASARQYFSTKKKSPIPTEIFDLIDFRAIQLALRDKPQMYHVWYAKQTSGWCATGSKLAQWDPEADSRCPNCFGLNEDAGHLMHCPSVHRTALFNKTITELKEWMDENGTHPALTKIVTLYLRERGRRKLSALLNIPAEFAQLCREQDQIGWRQFTEGRISTQFREIQERFLRVRHPRRNVETWLRGFVGKLLAMTHSQWIFRCISKHHRTKGLKALVTRDALQKEVVRQKKLGVDAMAEEDKWMLEVDVEGEAAEEQQYWLYAVEAARQAGAHALEASIGATSEWSEIVNGETYQHIPTHNPPHPPLELAPPRDKPTNSTRTLPQVTPKQPKKAKRKRNDTPRTKPSSTRVSSPTRQRQPSFRRRSNYCSSEATSNDTSGILTPFRERIPNDRRLVNDSFARPRRIETVWCAVNQRQVSNELRAYKYCNQSMTQSEFKGLAGREWLSDAVIDMFLKAFVTDTVDRAHCYSSHFFTNLFEQRDPNTSDINFAAVHNHSNAFGGLPAQGDPAITDLYVPTHVGGNHWIMIRVNFIDKAIEVYDPMGNVNPGHRRYMEGLRRYLFEDMHKTVDEHSRPQYWEWSQDWSLRDLSRHSPRQQNDYDCGVFTMVSIYLSSRGVTLSNETYDQHYVTSANLRYNLALALLKVNEEPDPSSPQTRLGFSRTARSQKSQRKRRRDSRVSKGGKRIRTESSSSDGHHTPQATPILNRKRTAKSLTDNDPTQRSIRQMFMGHGAKRKKKEIDPKP